MPEHTKKIKNERSREYKYCKIAAKNQCAKLEWQNAVIVQAVTCNCDC